jgi:hypothetical protein
MKAESHSQVGMDGIDDEGARIAMLARKATRKASRIAEKDGYYVEHADGVCIVRAAGKAVKVAVKTTPIDVRKHYVLASGTH